MSEGKETISKFLGTYFDRDLVLRLSRWAGIVGWIVLAVYLANWLGSVAQFSVQFASGLYFQKGMSAVDVFNMFTPYLLQPLPGFVYFIGLQAVSQVLLVFLDIEDNLRRAARK